MIQSRRGTESVRVALNGPTGKQEHVAQTAYRLPKMATNATFHNAQVITFRFEQDLFSKTLCTTQNYTVLESTSMEFIGISLVFILGKWSD